jgi:hypothetical protein
MSVSRELDELATTFVNNKETIKNLTKANKQLEKMICELMKENQIETYSVGGGTVKFNVKESVKLGN